MTTSPQTSYLSELSEGKAIPIGKLAYFRGRLTNRIHELVLTEFNRLENEEKISRAELARRIGRKPEQVTRWLGAAGNWTIETLSDLLLAMGCEPAMSISALVAHGTQIQTDGNSRISPLAVANEELQSFTNEWPWGMRAESREVGGSAINEHQQRTPNQISSKFMIASQQ